MPIKLHPGRLISWLMIGWGTSLLLYVASNVAYLNGTQEALTQQWDRTHAVIKQQAATATNSGAAPVLTFQRPRLARGQALAKILVPSIGWEGVVVEGSDSVILAGGPGHVNSTAYPGENDNVVISNHNSYSLAWSKARVGDPITLETSWGSFTYHITGFKIVDPNDGSVTASTHRPTLTFITCYPLWAGRFAPQRYVVLADLSR